MRDPHPTFLIAAAILSLADAVDQIRDPDPFFGALGWILAAGLFAHVAIRGREAARKEGPWSKR